MGAPIIDPYLAGAVVSAVQCTARVVKQERMARDTFRIRLACPDIAEQILPGQFFMVRAPGTDDPLLGRPFALYDVYEENGRKAGVDFGYIIVGKLTSAMTAWKTGDPVEVWGPLGNGFPLPTAEHLMLVAGGIGQTPFLAVAREALGLRQYGGRGRDERLESAGRNDAVDPLPRPSGSRHRAPTGGWAVDSRLSLRRVTMCYGVRSAEYLAGLNDFRMNGLELKISTDDGSEGHHGLVTDLLIESVDSADAPGAVFCCGPEPMMKAVQDICAARSVPCWLSLESPMACGFGVCFSCVTRVRLDASSSDACSLGRRKSDGWDYCRTCVEGPVFPAERLIL